MVPGKDVLISPGQLWQSLSVFMTVGLFEKPGRNKEIEDRRKHLYSAMYRLKANRQNRVNLVRDKLCEWEIIYTRKRPELQNLHTGDKNHTLNQIVSSLVLDIIGSLYLSIGDRCSRDTQNRKLHRLEETRSPERSLHPTPRTTFGSSANIQ